MTFDESLAQYSRWLDLTDDPDILRIIFGAILANKYDGIPVWMMILGPPGAGKSELMMSLEGAPEIYMVSSLTPHSLLSAYGTDSVSLLPKLRDKVLVIKDLSAISHSDSDARTQVFALLRDAYDGKVIRATGRGEIRSEGKFGILCAGVPVFEHERTMEGLLGERFLCVRPKLRGPSSLRDGMRSITVKQQMREDLRRAASGFLASATLATRSLPRTVHILIEKVARSLARVRGDLMRNNRTRDVEFPAVLEVPTRLFEQLTLFALGVKSAGASPDEIERMIHRLLRDNIPYVRNLVLGALADGVTAETDIVRLAGVSLSTVKRTISDLELLGVLSMSGSFHHRITDPILQEAYRHEAGTRAHA